MGVVGVALMLGATPDHAVASSLDAGEPCCDFFSWAPWGVKALFALANWAGVCVGRLSSH